MPADLIPIWGDEEQIELLLEAALDENKSKDERKEAIHDIGKLWHKRFEYGKRELILELSGVKYRYGQLEHNCNVYKKDAERLAGIANEQLKNYRDCQRKFEAYKAKVKMQSEAGIMTTD